MVGGNHGAMMVGMGSVGGWRKVRFERGSELLWVVLAGMVRAGGGAWDGVRRGRD